jgi:hypothetical protein
MRLQNIVAAFYSNCGRITPPMKKLARVLVSLISAGFLSLSVGWSYLIHAMRYFSMSKADPNAALWAMSDSDVTHLIMKTVLIGAIATVAMTWGFYRLIR